MQQTPLQCASCGTVLSVAGGRCPTCGTEQPQPPPTSARPRVELTNPAPKPTDKLKAAMPWLVLAGGLVVLGAAAALLAPEEEAATDAVAVDESPTTAAPAPSGPVDPNDLGIANESAADPSEILARAKTRALAWSKDALLLRLEAAPVLDGKVDLSGPGKIVYTFGTPTGEGFGPGAKVGAEQFVITLDSSGSKMDKVSAGGGRVALEPNCPLGEALTKASAAGVPAEAGVSLRYEFDQRRGKAIWTVGVPDDDSLSRVVDGWSCAILVR